MPNELSITTRSEASGLDLKRYSVSIPMATLAIGVDNIHHDVFLSPRFVQVAREYLFDLIRLSTSSMQFPGMERSTRGPDSVAFRKQLSELLQSALTQAKYHKNIEIDLLFRLSLLKFLTTEIGNQFANIILEGKEWVRKRGEHFERSQEAHVIKARLSELQASRRAVVRRVGQQIAQILSEIEDNTIVKTRRALFGEDFAPYYELCKNRLIFLDGGKDDVFFLEHYVLLGNYVKDPDRFEAMDALFQEFLREAGVTVTDDPAHKEAVDAHTALLESVQSIRSEIANLEEQREATRKRLERGEGFFNKLLSSTDPADIKASLQDIETRLKHQECKLEELGPQVEEAREKLDFFRKGKESRFAEYLNEPENAQRLFDAKTGPEESASLRAQLLTRLVERLEQYEMLFPVMASYEVRPIVAEYCPPVHLQQLRRALVSKDELKQVERVIKQVPAKKLSLKAIEELSRKIQRYTRDEMKECVLRFAGDFFRLHRDLRDAEHLATSMERINLVTTEKARELSRMNNRLYECVLPEEARPAQDTVVSHVIIKADVRGSTRMTQDLLSRGLNPASHFSLNLHEPVKKLLDRYDAKKVFIEGDAIILAIFETESTIAYARPVAKACILSRQILAVCNSYNERASSSDLPALELGLGVAFQGDAPTYWTDGESRIMISKALNLSDRLSGCAKLARRMLAKQKSHFSVFHFLNTMEGASAEELDEFLVRYNMNGIELNEEGFKKLSEEISLDSIETKLDQPWGKQNVTLFYGEVPLGETVELLVIRKAFARQLLPDGKIGRPTEHCYYEVCTSPALYDLVAALIRTNQTSSLVSART